MPPAETILRFVAALVVGYLVGSIPSGVVIGQFFGNVDPRTQGSGKTGTTNILRTLGPGPAAFVLLLDLGKGVAAVLLARYLIMPLSAGASPELRAWAEAAAGLAAILGRNPMRAITSRSRSMPGAISINSTPEACNRNTARSVT